MVCTFQKVSITVCFKENLCVVLHIESNMGNSFTKKLYWSTSKLMLFFSVYTETRITIHTKKKHSSDVEFCTCGNFLFNFVKLKIPKEHSKSLFIHFTGSPLLPVPHAFSFLSNMRGKPRRGMLRRAVFSDMQRKGLEKMFQKQKYISKPDRKKLAAKLGLKDSQVQIFVFKALECKTWS